VTASIDPRAAAELKRLHPSYHEPLRVARQWNRGDTPDRAAAAELLTGLAERYPTVLVVWYELALNRVKAGERPAALALLDEIHHQFEGRLDEDTFCLWGRCHKDAGHEHLDRGRRLPVGGAVPEREPDSPLVQSGAAAAADREYELGRQRYEQGYNLSGGWFPAVNVAFLTFMRAALAKQMGRPDESARLRGEAQDLARDLIERTDWALKLPDDDVWHEATRGEACALQGDWPGAIGHYRCAAGLPNAQPHHRESMGRQLARVLQGWDMLGEAARIDLAAQLPELSPFLNR
jgi:tetratricopeptide (TPR) repeat protein